LLDKGADINAQGKFYDSSLQGGHKTVVGLMLDKGADVSARAGEDGNALYAASFRWPRNGRRAAAEQECVRLALVSFSPLVAVLHGHTDMPDHILSWHDHSWKSVTHSAGGNEHRDGRHRRDIGSWHSLSSR
jgi:hypothetical protein